MSSFKRSNKEIANIYNRNIDLIYSLCFNYLRNKEDSEDAVQTSFIKLINTNPSFESEEHEKAWLIVTASNTCKDILKRKYKQDFPLEDFEENLKEEPFSHENSILEEVLSLPLYLRDVIYLHYYAGYKSEEIGKLKGKTPSAIRNNLHKAREILKEKLGGDFFE